MSIKQFHLVFLLQLVYIISFGQFKTIKQIQYSKNVDDSFEIYISKPPDFNENNSCKVVYYLDANLASGRYLRQLFLTSTYNQELNNVIFIGVGHTGNFHVQRRRDFIKSSSREATNNDQRGNYGKANNFYLFLKEELMPSINAKFKTLTDSNSVIGHSLGGLFAFYCLLSSDKLFYKYFVLSPSLWVDNYSVLNLEEDIQAFNEAKYLYLSAGTKETLNRIMTGTKKAKKLLDTSGFKNLFVEYEIWKGATHNSEVRLALNKIFQEKL